MQTRLRSRAVATPSQLQSVAALLPEEILDSIFAQFGFDYSMEVSLEDRAERGKNLCNMSVIAEGWTKPARRLLFRSARIMSWTHLQEEVGEDVGKQVRELNIRGGGWYKATSREAASAAFRLFKQLPNLRRLRLDYLPFDAFNPTDSASMQSTVLLPHLHDLTISGSLPHPIIFDLLAMSDHQISRLSVISMPVLSTPPLPHRQLDFRRNLRFLSTGPDFYRTLVDSRWMAHDGLVGLTELALQGIDERSREGGEELYRVIAPTLSKLWIDSGDFAWFERFLPLLSRLSRLSIGASYSAADPDPAPLLLCLPPSLAFLRLYIDHELGPSLARWTAAPSLVPTKLKHIQIQYIKEFETYQQLPPIETLCTNHQSNTLESLGRLSPGTLPFKTLEMRFNDDYSDRRSLVEAECGRLGVAFRQRLEFWEA